MMNPHVQQALEAALHTYAKIERLDAAVISTQLSSVFNADLPYMEKVIGMDAAFDDSPRFEALREPIFDLLLINFFAADVNKLEADYLESEEWEAIEDQTIDRGTELLNLLLYLRECADEDIDPYLDDYLKEFLLVDEDEFQDEHRIYEPVIANQLLVDSSYEAIAKAARQLPENQELAEFFYSLMGFFYEPNPSEQDWTAYVNASKNPAFDAAMYKLITQYNH
ncbi:hypothetical protein [Parapedobacter lycopersici]|uniref:hypothetical protein n=1 Tax=Parapedobacter lycopersici TaxID=1864939 RepID=UPI00333EA549